MIGRPPARLVPDDARGAGLHDRGRFGRIVNLSWTSALGNRGQVNYSAAKAGLQGFTKTLAWSWASSASPPTRWRPGFIETEMTRATAERLGVAFEDFIACGAKEIPVRRAASRRTSRDHLVPRQRRGGVRHRPGHLRGRRSEGVTGLTGWSFGPLWASTVSWPRRGGTLPANAAVAIAGIPLTAHSYSGPPTGEVDPQVPLTHVMLARDETPRLLARALFRFWMTSRSYLVQVGILLAVTLGAALVLRSVLSVAIVVAVLVLTPALLLRPVSALGAGVRAARVHARPRARCDAPRAYATPSRPR